MTRETEIFLKRMEEEGYEVTEVPCEGNGRLWRATPKREIDPAPPDTTEK